LQLNLSQNGYGSEDTVCQKTSLNVIAADFGKQTITKESRSGTNMLLLLQVLPVVLLLLLLLRLAACLLACLSAWVRCCCLG
jgi:hypothetical protein